MNTLKRELQKSLPFIGFFFLFHDSQSKCSKNDEKEEIEFEVVETVHGYETNYNTDFLV